MPESKKPRLTGAFFGLAEHYYYLLQIYIVTSKPKRMSEYSGLVHMIITS